MSKNLQSNPELWDLFIKKEEYETNKIDEYQRFMYKHSQFRDVLNPVVSDFFIKNGVRFEYPHDRDFAICLTHDIDLINFPIGQSFTKGALKSLNRLQLQQSVNISINRLKKIMNSERNFIQIMEMEENYNAISTFFFLCLDESNQDYFYNIENYKGVIDLIKEKGWEIGLHGGHEAFNNLDEIIKEKHRLEKQVGNNIIGYRNHFLKFEVPTTWTLLMEAGIKYDTTFGYADHIGFRNGLCHPFKPFNMKTNKYIEILEIPLAIMDTTLDEYMKLDIKCAWENIKKTIDLVRRMHGVDTILWHNTYMLDEQLELYNKILKYSQEQNAWITSGEQIYTWWKDNKLWEKCEL